MPRISKAVALLLFVVGDGAVSPCKMKTITRNISEGFSELQVKSAIKARVISNSGRGPSASNSVTITACEETIRQIQTSVGESSNRVPIGHGSGPISRLTLETTGPYAENCDAIIHVASPIGGIAVGDSSHVVVDMLSGDMAEGGSETFIDATAGSTIIFKDGSPDLSLQRLALSEYSIVKFEFPVDIPKYGQVKCTDHASVLVQGKPVTKYGCVNPEARHASDVPSPAVLV